MKKTIIKLENVWKIYKLGEVDVYALRGLNFAIREGEFVAIIGPSGAGKSTTLNMIGCLDLPTKGKVYLSGKDVSKLSEDELAKIRGRKIGFVFQTFNLISSLSALENVMVPMIFQNVERSRAIERAKHLLSIVGLEKRMHHKPFQLSGGERQRVAIARALANDPEIILADEPTGNLDSKTSEEIIDMFIKLHDDFGKTLVIITHELDIAKKAKRIERLQDGQIVSYVKDGELR